MAAIDNPSYFSLPTEARKKKLGLSFLRKRTEFSKPLTSSGSVAGIAATGNSNNCRRNFRSLTRSVSDDTHLLVLGKPRPSDLAPSVYNNTIVNHRRSATIPGHLISSEDLLHHDMIHCGGMIPEMQIKSDLRISKNDPKYCNTTTLSCRRFLNTRRRHSVGSIFHRDQKSAATTTTGTLPSIDTLKTQRENNLWKRTNRKLSAERVAGRADEDLLDILLVSSEDSEAACVWVNYLISCFQQICKEQNKAPFKFMKFNVEDTLKTENGLNNFEKCTSARLQIVIICPIFLQKMQNLIVTNGDFPLCKILHADRIVTMLLGVNDSTLASELKPVLPNYDQWRKMIVKDQDTTFVGDFLGVAMDILSRSWHFKEAINSLQQERTMFSILPKKIKVGQNKLIALLNESLAADDLVKVFVDKNGNRTEVNVKRRNPYTLQFSVPASCMQVSMLVNIQIEKNGKPLGHRMVKCESQMREIDQLLRSVDNPIQFLCQSFGLNTTDKEQLDSFLLATFLRNLPTQFNLLQPLPINRYSICNEEYPTLLHFSAKYGLEKLSWQLLESPGGEQACRLRNNAHLAPAEIAEKSGNTKLANALKGYMQMTELSSVYNYLKKFNDKKPQMDDGNYLLPRPLNDTYLIPPTARPIGSLPNQLTNSAFASGPFYENFKPCNFPTTSSTSVLPPNTLSIQTKSVSDLNHYNNYQIPRNGRPCIPQTPETPVSPTEENFPGYLDMNGSSKTESGNNFGSACSFNTNSDYLEHFENCSKLELPNSPSYETPDSVIGSRSGISSSSREKLSPDDELLEIINDFKNNVFTISEVEQLVESWQNRNDVQQSFREKQEQLQQMREEYERIQQRMKDQLHRPTPFEKIRRFFSRNKSKQSENNERASVSSDTSTNMTAMRPPSSISLHSSSSGSSGVTSTVYSGGGLIIQDQDCRTRICEKQNEIKGKKFNVYDEIPQPPKYLNLSSTSEEPQNEYMQLDCVICKTVSNKSTNNYSNNSVLNYVIDEVNEIDESSYKIFPNHEYTKIEKNYSSIKPSHVKFEKNADTKKSKSIENLLVEKPYVNLNIPKNKSLLLVENSNKIVKSNLDISKSTDKILGNEKLFGSLDRRRFMKKKDSKLLETSDNPIRKLGILENPKSINLSEQSACECLCTETMKCLTGITCNLASKDESGDELSFKFEKALGSSNVSECGSKHNSNFDLTSLSSNSSAIAESATISDKEGICTLEIQITENVENEVTSAPPAPAQDDEDCIFNVCDFPEYANISITSPPPLPPRCQYGTTVTM